MKAFVSEKYGPPEMLRMAEVKKPSPAAEEALVKVLAVSVNPADWRSMRAKPFFSRATMGLLRPKHRILGGDIAGRVEAVGGDVKQFKPGDEVYANLLDHGNGGFAEYVSVPVEAMSFKPANLSFEFSKSSRGHRGSSAFDGVPVLGAVKVVQPWGAPS
jgi:NADPH:quinone reductase-like Zn-dependent oxidoreductase